MARSSRSAKMSAVKDPKRVTAGKRARAKGPAFERKIATDMRTIYDPPALTRQLAELHGQRKVPGKQAEYRALQKSSRVRRSDQGRGAKEPDLVIEGCPCWLELQDATGHSYSPLLQAEKDVAEADSELWPVSVCHQSGRTSIESCLRLGTLVALTGVAELNMMTAESMLIPVIIDYGALKGMLERYEARRSEAS
jgi:hypothetical protein